MAESSILQDIIDFVLEGIDRLRDIKEDTPLLASKIIRSAKKAVKTTMGLFGFRTEPQDPKPMIMGPTLTSLPADLIIRIGEFVMEGPSRIQILPTTTDHREAAGEKRQHEYDIPGLFNAEAPFINTKRRQPLASRVDWSCRELTSLRLTCRQLNNTLRHLCDPACVTALECLQALPDPKAPDRKLRQQWRHLRVPQSIKLGQIKSLFLRSAHFWTMDMSKVAAQLPNVCELILGESLLPHVTINHEDMQKYLTPVADRQLFLMAKVHVFACTKKSDLLCRRKLVFAKGILTQVKFVATSDQRERDCLWVMVDLARDAVVSKQRIRYSTGSDGHTNSASV